MTVKCVTPQIAATLKDLPATIIPPHLQIKANSLNIRYVYFFEIDLSTMGIYGNCVVILNNGMLLDLQIIPNDIESLFHILTDK